MSETIRDSFIFYRSFYEAIKDLPRDVQGEVYTAIMEYSLNGITTEQLKPIARSIFTLIKPNLDANKARYENGSKGGRPKKETKLKPNHNRIGTKPKPNKDVNEDKDYNDDEIEKPTSPEIPLQLPNPIQNYDYGSQSVEILGDKILKDGSMEFTMNAKRVFINTEEGISVFEKLVSEFNGHCRATNKAFRPENEYRSHFVNWINKQPSSAFKIEKSLNAGSIISDAERIKNKYG